LSADGRTFGTLRRGLPGIKQQVLSEQLKALAADGIVDRSRTVLGNREFSRYTLTEEGNTLIPLMRALSDWGSSRLLARGIVWDSPLPPLQLR
jgi:DNA-binding HxlR family transcriptional regulator